MSSTSGINRLKVLRMIERRNLRNSASRSRLQSRKAEIQTIKSKTRDQRTPEELRILEVHEAEHLKKNCRSKERNEEMKLEVNRILEKPMEQRSAHESKYVEDVLGRNMRKNLGDTLRRLSKTGEAQEDLKLSSLSQRKGKTKKTRLPPFK